MTETVHTDADPALPPPTLHQRPPWWSISLIWLVPVIAALIGGSLAIRSYLNQGPKITISFETAEGLAAGKTEVRYKEVVIGQVREIRLSPDRSHVRVIVELDKSASSFAVADTRFWVVRPRIGIGGVSGIGTLFSGAYIGVDVGQSAEERFDFEGLENPPPVVHGTPGKRFVLHSSDLGSLDIGSPVYYRRIQVGHVVAFNLDPDGKSITLQIFVDAPNDRYVTKDARFWNASGVDFSLSATGVQLTTQSLATVIAGGVAFQSASDDDKDAASEGAEFTVHSNVADAMKPPDGPALQIVMRFKETVQGLTVGAPVDFRGVSLGNVSDVKLDYDPVSHSFPTDVTANIYPQRLGPVQEKLAKGGDLSNGEFLKPLVEHGFRAQSRTGSLLTGQLYIALDFVRNAPQAKFDTKASPVEIPTVPAAFSDVQDQIADIVHKIDAIPFDKLGTQLQGTLQSADNLLRQLDTQLAPQATATLNKAQETLASLNAGLAEDSALQTNARQTLDEVHRAVRSFRELADYLERHPESLIRGKSGDPAPATAPSPQGDKP